MYVRSRVGVLDRLGSVALGVGESRMPVRFGRDPSRSDSLRRQSRWYGQGTVISSGDDLDGGVARETVKFGLDGRL